MKFPALDEVNERVADLTNQRGELLTRARAMLDGAEAQQRDLTAAERTEHEGVLKDIERITAELEEAKTKQRKCENLAEMIRTGKYGTEPGDGARQRGVLVGGTDGAGTLRDQARRTIDRAFQRKELPDYAAERATELLSSGPTAEQTIAARWAVATGDEHYRTAFAKLLAEPTRGHMLWTPEEHEAYQRVAEVRSLMRAMSTAAGAGGEMVPLTLDPAIMLTSDGSANPLRRLARVVRTVTNSWRGITSAGVTAEWKAEGVEAADASPTLADVDIPVYFGDAFVPYSFEVGMDALDFTTQLSMLLTDAADQLQATAYVNGSGSGQPTGITTALPAGSKIAAASADTIVAADVVGLQNALPPRWQARAQWAANITTINTIGSMETANGALRFPEVGNGRLLNRPLNEASHLDAAGDTATAGNDNVLIYGDWSQFVIVDRIGSQVELIQNLVGANRRPTGQRGVMLWFRTGSDVTVDNAFRMLTA